MDKRKEITAMICDVVQEIYKNSDMIETIKNTVKEKHINPQKKTHGKNFGKINMVKL